MLIEIRKAGTNLQYKICKEWGTFATLAFSGIIFFGVYFIILVLAKEPLVCEIKNQIVEKLPKRN